MNPHKIAVAHIPGVCFAILKAAPPTNIIKIWNPPMINAIEIKYQFLNKC